MLHSLTIKDYLLIDQLSINFDKGLTVLTGETGTGKSILLDALALVTGARADKTLIRYGADCSIITAVFTPNKDNEIYNILSSHGLPSTDEEISLRRLLHVDGKNRSFINDTPVSNNLLKIVGEFLLEIHGQNAEQGFLSPRTHLNLLDLYADLKPLVKDVNNLYHQIKKEKQELLDLQSEITTQNNLLDYYKQLIDDISELNPLQNEETNLIEQRSILMVGEKSREVLGDFNQYMRSTNFFDDIAKFSRSISTVSSKNKNLEPFNDQIDELLNIGDNMNESISFFINENNEDKNRLEEVETRLQYLRSVSRKYNYPTDQLEQLLLETKTKFEKINNSITDNNNKEKEIKKLTEEYNKKSQQLTKKRTISSKKLAQNVNEEIKELKLGIASFNVELSTIEHGAFGQDKVIFTISTNANMPTGPLHQIASGGELSRFVLALKAALATQEAKTVIIFDEVDAGIGGSVASAVGERLYKLGQETQILVITHSPQVASKAKHHFVVRKSTQGNVSTSSLKKLSNDERVEEIARMLSGEKITQAARDAANSLLINE